jgi:hypothetical protein
MPCQRADGNAKAALPFGENPGQDSLSPNQSIVDLLLTGRQSLSNPAVNSTLTGVCACPARQPIKKLFVNSGQFIAMATKRRIHRRREKNMTDWAIFTDQRQRFID